MIREEVANVPAELTDAELEAVVGGMAKTDPPAGGNTPPKKPGLLKKKT